MKGNVDIDIPLNGNRFNTSGIILSAKIYPTMDSLNPI
jgi:hypothetical protein